MNIRQLHPAEVNAALTPLGFTVRRKDRAYNYTVIPAPGILELLGPKGAGKGAPCIHGYARIIVALRAVRPNVEITPGNGEVELYRALSAAASGVEVPMDRKATAHGCSCVRKREGL